MEVLDEFAEVADRDIAIGHMWRDEGIAAASWLTVQGLSRLHLDVLSPAHALSAGS
jgi:hypothetical protein